MSAPRTASPLRPWLELVRLPAVFTAPADVLAGLALGHGLVGVAPSLLQTLGLVGASAALYCAGMAANDLFDRQVDAVERPGRPLPSGRVSVRGAWSLVLGLQALGLGLAAVVGLPSLAAAAAVVAAVYLYNGGAKNTALGPWSMALCRYANAALGLSLAAAALPASTWLLPLGTVVFVVGVTGLSRHEVAGAQRSTLRLPMLALGLGVLTPAVLALVGCLPATWAAATALGTAAWLQGPLRRAWAQPGPGTVRGAVMAGIFGIAMVNAQLAFGAGVPWYGLATLALLVPGRLFGRWFYAT